MWEYNEKQKQKENRDIVDADQSLWNSSNAYYNLKNSNNSRNYGNQGNFPDNTSNSSVAKSSTRTLPVKPASKAILNDSSDMNDTDEGRGSPTRTLDQNHDLTNAFLLT